MLLRIDRTLVAKASASRAMGAPSPLLASAKFFCLPRIALYRPERGSHRLHPAPRYGDRGRRPHLCTTLKLVENYSDR